MPSASWKMHLLSFRKRSHARERVAAFPVLLGLSKRKGRAAFATRPRERALRVPQTSGGFDIRASPSMSGLVSSPGIRSASGASKR